MANGWITFLTRVLACKNSCKASNKDQNQYFTYFGLNELCVLVHFDSKFISQIYKTIRFALFSPQ